jgi:multidrug efflux system outer membrane protein
MSIGRAAALPLALLAGCSMTPRYTVPAVPVTAAYKEAGPWVAAAPADEAPRGPWWQRFGDAPLSDLESRIERNSPTLAAALARRNQAAALLRRARGGLFPEIDLDGSASRERISAGRPFGSGAAATGNDFVVGGTLSYEVDLWGKIRAQVAAGRADLQASAADLAATRLSLQAQLADAYFRLRGLDAELALLRETVDAYARAYELTATRHDGGIASGLDVNRARTQLATARAQISDIANDRAAIEHAIAVLVGETPSGFSLAPVRTLADPPPATGETPSLLLQRRADIAAAERRVAAANARVGVARAALYPSLNLGLSGGFEAGAGALFAAPNLFWALGPSTLLAPIIDGGRRRADVANARAQLDESAANYRQTVLDAFREVEDQLAAVHHLGKEAVDQRDAVVSAERTRDLALTRYRDGASDYLEVVVAQTAALDAERAELGLKTRRLQAVVDLIRTLGGDPNVPPA